MIGSIRVLSRSLAAAGVLAAWAASSMRDNPADAAIPSPVGFSVDFSPSALLLDALDDKRDGTITGEEYYDIKYDESCDNPHLRVRARNKPAVMITNFGMPVESFNSAAPITSVSITLNDSHYMFGNGDTGVDGFSNYIKNWVMYADPGVSITGTLVDNAMNPKKLTVNFSGLTAGLRVIFGIDLDIDPTSPNAASYYMYPDYRAALFGAPLSSSASPTAPATIEANFGTAPDLKTLSLTLPQETTTPTWMNDHIRPYRSQDKMETPGSSSQVPEPGAIILSFVGLAALAGLRRRAAGKA